MTRPFAIQQKIERYWQEVYELAEDNRDYKRLMAIAFALRAIEKQYPRNSELLPIIETT